MTDNIKDFENQLTEVNKLRAEIERLLRGRGERIAELERVNGRLEEKLEGLRLKGLLPESESGREIRRLHERIAELKAVYLARTDDVDELQTDNEQLRAAIESVIDSLNSKHAAHYTVNGGYYADLLSKALEQNK